MEEKGGGPNEKRTKHEEKKEKIDLGRNKGFKRQLENHRDFAHGVFRLLRSFLSIDRRHRTDPFRLFRSYVRLEMSVLPCCTANPRGILHEKLPILR